MHYRGPDGSEPVNDWLESVLPTKPAAVAKIDDFVEEHLNNRSADEPPREFPITSQIEGGLRELRVRFANTRYRLLYQRSGNLLVLLHAFEKTPAPFRLPTSNLRRNASRTSKQGWTLRPASGLALPGTMRHPGAGSSDEPGGSDSRLGRPKRVAPAGAVPIAMPATNTRGSASFVRPIQLPPTCASDASSSDSLKSRSPKPPTPPTPPSPASRTGLTCRN